MKAVFVNRFFYPDLAPTGLLAADVAFDLARRGWEVHAVTSRQRYQDAGAGLPAGETISGVRVHRVWSTRFGRAGTLGRAFDYASFYVSATLALVRLLRKGDVVVAKTDPPLISVFALLAARMRGARLVNWLEDVFPEVAQHVGMRLGPVALIAKWLRNASVRGASANVMLGARMEAEVARLVPGTRLERIADWADGEAIRPLAFPSGKFVVGYSGNFGRAHEWETVVRAIGLLRDEPGLAFSFTGGGHHFPRIVGLPNVVHRGYVPQERLSENLAASDVHLVTLLPQLEGLIMPSKLYGAMAAGRPVLFVGDLDGEVARMLRDHQCGLSVAAGDAEGLAKVVLDLKAHREICREMGQRARAAFEAHYDKPIGVERWRVLLEKIARA
ncbi:MAG: glycosyltransferase WbuB [Betaproteobacteria bacterium]|nr:MAG: glycosyltransferase WbuB [Betaproteobacteria bacterium]